MGLSFRGFYGLGLRFFGFLSEGSAGLGLLVF